MSGTVAQDHYGVGNVVLCQYIIFIYNYIYQYIYIYKCTEPEYFTIPTWHHSWMNGRHNMFWSLGKAINWYRLRRDMIRPISPQAVAESVCWCGVMMWGLHPPQVQDFHAACVSPHFSDCNAYVKVRLSCLDDPWWPQKVNQRCRNSIDKYRQIQNSPFNLSLSLSLSLGIFEIRFMWSWNQHWALPQVSCLQGASRFQGSTSCKFYPCTAGRSYFCHLVAWKRITKTREASANF